MLVEASFVGDLVSQKLGVVTSRDAFVYDFLSAFSCHEVGVGKLCHLNVVGEDVDWDFVSFSDSDEFFVFVVRPIGSIYVQFIYSAGALEGGDWSQNFSKSLVSLPVLDPQA